MLLEETLTDEAREYKVSWRGDEALLEWFAVGGGEGALLERFAVGGVRGTAGMVCSWRG